MVCEVDGRDILEHAEEGDCSLGFYAPGAAILPNRQGTYRPIAAPSAASPRLIAARQAVCDSCPHKLKGYCELCGCTLASKIRDCDSGCPAKKWGPAAPENREVWYSHTGAIGDIIYAIPGMRIDAKGRPISIYIHHDAAVRRSDYMTPRHVEAAMPLLLAQPGILHVEHTDPWPTATHRLDTFRDLDIYKNDLVTLHCMALGVTPPAKLEPWLTVKPMPVARVLFHRSPRYANPFRAELWEKFLRTWPEAVFVGLPEEYQQFCREVSSHRWEHAANRLANIPYLPTKDLHELARIIAGADLFVGNQSAPFAIATGLGKRTILEVDPVIPNCCFDREEAIDIWSPAQEIDPPASPVMLVYHDLDLAGHADEKRVNNARLTWRWARNIDKGLRLLPFKPIRTSHDIGDSRFVPYLRDILDAGAEAAGDGIVIWCNLDCCLVPKTLPILRRELTLKPCVYSRRVDVKDARTNYMLHDLLKLKAHPGTDLFAFHASWWRRVRDSMPDFFIACEAFDFVMRRMMERDNPTAEVGPLVYHEDHEPFWRDPANVRVNPAQAHNRKLAREWCEANGYADRLAGENAPGLLLDDLTPPASG